MRSSRHLLFSGKLCDRARVERERYKQKHSFIQKLEVSSALFLKKCHCVCPKKMNTISLCPRERFFLLFSVLRAFAY